MPGLSLRTMTGTSEKPKYIEVNFEISDDLMELMYVFGVYANEIAKAG